MERLIQDGRRASRPFTHSRLTLASQATLDCIARHSSPTFHEREYPPTVEGSIHHFTGPNLSRAERI